MLRAPWLGGARLPPAARRPPSTTPWRSSAASSAPSGAWPPAEGPVRRGRSSPRSEDRQTGPGTAMCLASPPSMPTCRWTVRPGSRSAPTGSGRSGAARFCSWTPIPAVAAASRRRAWTTRSASGPRGLLAQRVHVNVDSTPAGLLQQQQHPDLLRGTAGRDRPAGRRRDRGVPAPPSRFLTAAVPANNFGVNATFEVGPVQIQTLAATQKGSVVARADLHGGPDHQPGPGPPGARPRFRERPLLLGGRPRQPARVSGLDILDSPRPRSRRADRPGQVRVYRYRASAEQERRQSQSGRDHRAGQPQDSPQRFGPVRWELLIQGVDYYLDQSGLWIVLGTKLDQNDYLAVSYRTAAGTTVGTFPEADGDRCGGVAEPGHPRADRPAAAGADPPDLPVRDAAGIPGGRRRSGSLVARGSGSPSTAASGR